MAILHTELCTSYVVRYVVQIGCLVTSGSDDGVGKYSKRQLHKSSIHTPTRALFLFARFGLQNYYKPALQLSPIMQHTTLPNE